MHNRSLPKRILFVFAWLVVGGEETEVRLLAQNLDRRRYTLEVVPCFRKPNIPEQTHCQLEALDVTVDKTPYQLSFEDTVAYLAQKIPHYDLVVACQAVPDVYPALERLAHRTHGLFVPHEAPAEVAAALTVLARDPALRQRLGRNLQRKVEAEYSAEVVTGQWEALFDELLQPTATPRPTAISSTMPWRTGQPVVVYT